MTERIERSADFVQSLERGLAVIRAFDAAHPELTLSDVARQTGLTRAAARRFLHTLVELGYMRFDGRLFALRPRVLELGYAYLSSQSLPEIALPHLEALAGQVHESCSVSVLDGDEVVYVAQVPSRHSMRMFTEVGRRVLPHSTGVGKALLAGHPPEEVRAMLARTGMPAATERTITTPEGFLAALDHVRTAGYAMDDNEQELGVRCIAVPVPDSPTAAAISISGPAGRVTEAATDKFVPLMHEVAEQLSKALASNGSSGG
jgi:IclR family transcriptional regulator, acetate operon repressor